MKNESSASKISEKLDFLLVVPVYKEEKIIEENVKSLVNYLDSLKLRYRIVISVAPSPDNTLQKAMEIKSNYEGVDVIREEKKMGRGFSVREAWKGYNANVYAFIDADLSTGIEVIEKSIKIVGSGEYDIVVASRYVGGGSARRPPLRKFVSKKYNGLMNSIFKTNLKDFQCGYKAAGKSVIDYVIPKTTINSWFWDAELLVIAISLGFRVKEIPVRWIEYKYNKTSFRRLASDIFLHGSGILYLKGEIINLKK